MRAGPGPLSTCERMSLYFSDLQMKCHCPGLRQNPSPTVTHPIVMGGVGWSTLVSPSDSLRPLGRTPGIPRPVEPSCSLEDVSAFMHTLPTLAASVFLTSSSESSTENPPLSHQEAGAAGGMWVLQENSYFNGI